METGETADRNEVVALTSCCGGTGAAGQGAAASLSGVGTHPLDPLTPVEIEEAVRIVWVSLGGHSVAVRFETVTLDEPSPDELKGFPVGWRCERRAFVATYSGATGVEEWFLSLTRRMVLRRVFRHGARPRIAPEEMLLAEKVVLADPGVVRALRARGVTDLSLVCADAWSTSVLGDPIENERRLIHTYFWVRTRSFDNQYAHPIEGLTAFVDINAEVVVRIDDRGVAPIPHRQENYAARFQDRWRLRMKPIETVQPEGPSFTVDGNWVSWCGWQFHIGFTAREGLVLHKLSLRDGDRQRPVISRAALAEMIVPYGSPSEAHARKNAFDCGEYGIGACANSLTLGCDCLGVIRYFDAVLNTIDGHATTIRNAICLHEEDAGILWKHTDFRTGEIDVRRNRRLIISFISTVGNYEYAFYWSLSLDGCIELEVKLTGIPNTSGLTDGTSDPHGALLAPGVVGHIHQHIFNVRLDMEVDGPTNTVIEVDTVEDPPGPGNRFGNAVRLTETVLETELEARRSAEPTRRRFWLIANRGRRNRTGGAVAYRLAPRSSVVPIGRENAQSMVRGGFTRHDLWVTPTRPDERWPAGDYVNQSQPGQGLPRWTEADRPISDERITVWHSFGHHHVTRLEDFPVQPVALCGFSLHPFGFFDRNPTLDVPPARSSHSCCV